MPIITDISPYLDPELAPAFRELPLTDAEGELDPVSARPMMRAFAAQMLKALPQGPEVEVEDRTIPGAAGDPPIPLRIYRPTNEDSDCVMLWIHGGGFLLGHHEDEGYVAYPWVRATGCTVVSVGYRLAPEHRYPAATNDCFTALKWVAGATGPLDTDPRKLAVGGMSAGACLAAATVLRARDEAGPHIDFQMLLIPVLDNRHETASSQNIADPRTWNPASSHSAWAQYYGEDFLGDIPAYAAPARATDLTGLPPTYVEAAEMDNLRDEAIIYANRLMQAGVRTELHVYPGTHHGSTIGQPHAAISRRAMADSISALQAALA